ncbi:MAG TPA: YjbH domain-containing protein, partial [Anaeromyxobacteraceae bacterium]|nr:YjbH domain-containing protein [Anaeromyxobacteraceae bacterium]
EASSAARTGDARPVAAASGPASGAENELQSLEDALVDAGFEEVRVGRDGELLVVEYENNRFNHAESDGLAVVRSEVAAAGLGDAPVAVVLKRSGIRMVEVVLAPGAHAAERWTWHPRARDAAWVSASPRNRVALHSALVLAPGLRTFVAWDRSILDYALSFRPDLIVQLWPGATAFGRADVQLLRSDDLGDGRLLNRYRHDPRLEFATVHQAVPLARGLMAMIGGGLYRASEAGVVAEALWLSGDGTHAFGVQGTRTWDDERVGRYAATVSWRGRYAPLDLVATVRAGQFHAGDRGASIELSRWFGATELGFYYADTDVRLAGAFISLPLTPRRDMRPGWLQVRGARRWDHEIASVVGGTRNPLTTGVAEPPLAPWNLESSYRDSGRLSADGLLGSADR